MIGPPCTGTQDGAQRTFFRCFARYAALSPTIGFTAQGIVFLFQCETYEIAPGRPTHGYSGPLKVSHGGAFLEAAKEFLDVASQYDTARGSTDDVNGLFEANKYGVSTQLPRSPPASLNDFFAEMAEVNLPDCKFGGIADLNYR